MTDCEGIYFDEEDLSWKNRQWIRHEYHFDNTASSMLTLFEVSTLEMWPDYMFTAIDSRYEETPVTNYEPIWALFFVVFIFVTAFFIMNLFVGVMIDKFNEIQKEMNGSAFLTEEQEEWVKVQRLMVTARPRILYSPPRHKGR